MCFCTNKFFTFFIWSVWRVDKLYILLFHSFFQFEKENQNRSDPYQPLGFVSTTATAHYLLVEQYTHEMKCVGLIMHTFRIILLSLFTLLLSFFMNAYKTDYKNYRRIPSNSRNACFFPSRERERILMLLIDIILHISLLFCQSNYRLEKCLFTPFDFLPSVSYYIC